MSGKVSGFSYPLSSRILPFCRAAEYNGPAEPVHQFMLSQAPNSTEPHTESD